MNIELNSQTLEKFMELVDSLKKYERAELNYDNENRVEELYTDPINNNFILNIMTKKQTTLLVGRRGTGKSTIINRFQHEIRKNKKQLSLYLNVKSIYTQASENHYESMENCADKRIFNEKDRTKFLLYVAFLKNIISEIKKEMHNTLFKSPINVFSGKPTKEKFKKQLEEIFQRSLNHYVDFSTTKETTVKATNIDLLRIKEFTEKELTLKPELSLSDEGFGANIFTAKTGTGKEKRREQQEYTAKEYSQILVRHFNIIDLMNNIKNMLGEIEIDTVFICLDDASEIEEEALDMFVRTLISPLHTASSGFFKFKISFYPGRICLADIDTTKLDTINLDYYELYRTHAKDKMEELATEYTERLLRKRFEYFFGKDVTLEDFFDTKVSLIKEYFKTIFYASANIPRFIGKILWYASGESIGSGKKITKKHIKDAASKHYEDDIKVALYNNKFIIYKNYAEKYEREHLKNLLIKFIEKARDNKKIVASSDSEIFKKYNMHNATSNYLYFKPNYEKLISSLELNFFITKYTQQKDRESNEISVYSLNYGLCESENIFFDEGEADRKYRIQRLFDFNEIIEDWASTKTEIYCTNCETIHPIEKLEAIKMLEMICTNCRMNTCIERTQKINVPKAEIQIAEIQFSILNTLKNNKTTMTAKEIGDELDLTGQTIGAYLRADRQMKKANYVAIENKKYTITEQAIKTFFSPE